MAEISCNHSGSIENAINLISAAKEATADAVKIQVYTPDDMTINKREYSKGYEPKIHTGGYELTTEFFINDGPWKGRHLYDLYNETQTPYEFVKPLFEYAKLINMPIFASVFSKKAINLLEGLNCQAYKIASFEANDLELIKYAARTNKSIVLSTGMLNNDEIYEASRELNPLNSVIMHCISEYPAKVQECNLYKIRLFNEHGWLAGFSDHTLGIEAAPLACALGARMIERHLSCTGSNSGQDAHFSASPATFKDMAEACRRAALAVQKCDVPGEQSSRQFRRSLYVVKDIKEGEKFTSENIKSIRPSYGLHPNRYQEVIHEKYASQDIKAGTALKEEHLTNVRKSN